MIKKKRKKITKAKFLKASNRLYEDFKYKDEYINALKIIYQFKEGKNCTFQPKINQGFLFSPSYYQNKPIYYNQPHNLKSNMSNLINNNSFSYSNINQIKHPFTNETTQYYYPTPSSQLKKDNLWRTSPQMGINDINQNIISPNKKKGHSKTSSMQDNKNNRTDYHINTSFVDLDQTYLYTRLNSPRKIYNYSSLRSPNDCCGFLTHRIARNSSSLNLNNKSNRASKEENFYPYSNRINYNTYSNKLPSNNHKRQSSGSISFIDNNNKETRTKETIDATKTQTHLQNQTIQKNNGTSNSTLKLDMQNSIESNHNPNNILSIANGQFSLPPSYPQVTHVTLQSLSDNKILEMANHYVGTDESLEKFKLNLKK